MSKVFLALMLSFSVFSSAWSFDKIIKLKKNVNIEDVSGVLQSKLLFGQVYAVVIDDNFSDKNSDQLVYVENNTSTKKNINKLPRPDKNIVEFKSRGNTAFNDPQVSKIWSFNHSSAHGVSVNHAYISRGNTPANQQVIVAVVDTGVDFSHQDLQSVMWVNKKEIPNNKIDDDNNGYIDDIHGINTLIRDGQGRATVDMRDTHGHGTHVSGTIGAAQNNFIGIAGIASNVKIMGIRTVPNAADELDVDVIEAFIYAARNGAKIINCSFGKDVNEGGMAVSEAIEYIGQNYGVLVVVAAGNSTRNIDSRPTYPASFSNANLLVVASTDANGRLSYFSNFGPIGVDLAAPGGAIYSTYPGNRYTSMSGTSMASPTTAGVAAEVLSRNPHLNPIQLKEVLMRSATPRSDFNGRMVSPGRVDLNNALTIANFF